MRERQDEETITLEEAERLVGKATRIYLGKLKELQRPLDVGVGDIKSFADLAEARERIEAAHWAIVSDTYGVERPEGLTPRMQLQLFEYEKTQDMHKHYNTVNTALMLVLITIGVAGWGSLTVASRGVLSTVGPSSVGVFNLALFAVSSLIMYYMSINRQIMQFKCDRLKEIEENLIHLDQHSRFFYQRRKRLRTLLGPGGQSTEILIYWTLSFSSSILAAIAVMPRGWPWMVVACLPLPIAIWWGARCKALIASAIRDYRVRPWQKLWLALGGYRGYRDIPEETP